MEKEKSCGAVVFTKENGYIQYVIIQSQNGFYGFPKGHMERGETEAETALREIREETGLLVHLIDGFRMEDCYPICCNGTQRMKGVVYFLAEYSAQTPVAQATEVKTIHKLRYEDALTVLQFESSRKMLAQAHAFLKACV